MRAMEGSRIRLAIVVLSRDDVSDLCKKTDKKVLFKLIGDFADED